MTKANVTQAQAIRYLIDNASAETPADIIAAAEALYKAKTKKYDRPKTVSKEARENAEIAESFYEMIVSNPDELINTVWLNDHCDDARVRSPQKARAVVTVLINDGRVVRYTEKNKTYYKASQTVKGSAARWSLFFYFLFLTLACLCDTMEVEPIFLFFLRQTTLSRNAYQFSVSIGYHPQAQYYIIMLTLYCQQQKKYFFL